MPPLLLSVVCRMLLRARLSGLSPLSGVCAVHSTDGGDRGGVARHRL